MAASGVRHFPDRRDEALDWTDRMFAFNTTCFNCHVTELSTNYDLATDTYHTTWAEPGISCESCHGSAKEHVRVMEKPSDVHKVQGHQDHPRQGFHGPRRRTTCAPPATRSWSPCRSSFRPGDKFFDHFDLITLEHADFYPDGRDLGENYTYTSWLMSPCAKSGKLDCNHCHTPSGRMRFEGEKSNQTCMPCHEKEVKQPAEHGHHQAGSKGNECIACHMPMTRFAAMGRTDHSMRPPTPATTLAFKSPNACNLCHADHDAAWADGWVRKWYTNDYQAEVLRRAELIDLARKRQWKRLPEMLAELQKQGGRRGLQDVAGAAAARLRRRAQVAGPPRAASRSVAAGPLQCGVGIGRSLDAARCSRPCWRPRPIRRGWCGFAPRCRWRRCRRNRWPASAIGRIWKRRTAISSRPCTPGRTIGLRTPTWATSTWKAATSPRPPLASRRRPSWSRGRSARWSMPRWPTATWPRTTRPSRACAGR